MPTATPLPSTVTGTVVRTREDEIVVARDGDRGEPVGYTLDAQAAVTRDGKPAKLVKVAKGDGVRLTVNGGTKLVTEVVAQPAPVSLLSRLAKLLWLVPLGLAVPAYVWAKGRQPVEPFALKRIAQ